MVEVMQAFDDSNIKDVFDAFPDEVRPTLLAVRELIFNVAANNDNIGALSERLRWGQVSYLTKQTKSGSNVRIDALLRHKLLFTLFAHLIWSKNSEGIMETYLPFQKTERSTLTLIRHCPLPQ